MFALPGIFDQGSSTGSYVLGSDASFWFDALDAAFDKSSNNFSATASSALPSLTTENGVTTYSFNGVDQRLEYGDVLDSLIHNGANTRFICVAVSKPNNIAGANYFQTKYRQNTSGSNDSGMTIGFLSNEQFLTLSKFGDTDRNRISGQSTINNSIFEIYGYIFDTNLNNANRGRLFVRGTEIAKDLDINGSGENPGNNAPFTIGGLTGDTINVFYSGFLSAVYFAPIPIGTDGTVRLAEISNALAIRYGI